MYIQSVPFDLATNERSGGTPPNHLDAASSGIASHHGSLALLPANIRFCVTSSSDKPRSLTYSVVAHKAYCMTTRAIVHKKFSPILQRGPVHNVCVCMVKMNLARSKTFNERALKKNKGLEILNFSYITP